MAPRLLLIHVGQKEHRQVPEAEPGDWCRWRPGKLGGPRCLEARGSPLPVLTTGCMTRALAGSDQ